MKVEIITKEDALAAQRAFFFISGVIRSLDTRGLSRSALTELETFLDRAIVVANWKN